jgi:hypothetical protein
MKKVILCLLVGFMGLGVVATASIESQPADEMVSEDHGGPVRNFFKHRRAKRDQRTEFVVPSEFR